MVNRAVMSVTYNCGAEWDRETRFPLNFVTPCPKAMEIAVAHVAAQRPRSPLEQARDALVVAALEWWAAWNNGDGLLPTKQKVGQAAGLAVGVTDDKLFAAVAAYSAAQDETK